ncbi:MAG: glycogen debranching enzyme N-terminal domain-containing protein, partial [bacterium]|nr:glycogen debranching enzyme N-terminal domain-containing protein [bacterium]
MFSKELLTDFIKATTTEWLMVNKNGAYSLGTISGSTARIYSSLLTVYHENKRLALLNKLEDSLIIENKRYDLSSQLYPGGVIYPHGYNNIVEFEFTSFPRWRFYINGVILERKYILLENEDTLIAYYRIINSPYEAEKLKIEVRPLVTFKSH